LILVFILILTYILTVFLDLIKENEVGGACGTHGEGEIRVHGFGGKALGKKTS
jgi:hypothetical protein